MKKILMAVMAVATIAMIGCKPKNPVEGGNENNGGGTETKDYPTFAAQDGKYVIVINFEGPVCEGAKIAFPNASKLKEGSADWATDLDAIDYMEVVTKDEANVDFTGKNWYKVVIEYGDSLKGKPVLVPEGATAFDWNFQSGDVASWTILAGEPQIVAGFSDEADVCYPKQGVYVLKSAYWKKQVNPCEQTIYAAVKFILHVPAGTPDTLGAPKIHGANPLDWGGLDMVKEADGTYTYEAKEVPDGTEFQFTLGGNWDYKAIWEDAEYNCSDANFSVTGTTMEVSPTEFAKGCPKDDTEE